MKEKRSWRGEQGQALVEFAVSLPVLLIVVVGIAQCGIVFNNYLMLTEAVRVGSRQLATIRGQTTNPCLTAATKLKAAANNLTQTSIGVSVVINGTTYPSATCASATLIAGTDGTVTGTYPCQLKIMGVNFTPTCTLTAQTTGRIE